MKKIIFIILLVFAGLEAFSQWTVLSTGVTTDLNRIQFIDQNNGYSVGDNGIFLKTTDGGANWTIKTFFTGENFRNVYFMDASLGFICSDNHIYRTIDGGLNFTDITSVLQHPLTPSIPMTEIKMSFNDSVGIITASWYGDTTISFKTETAGNTWQPFSLPATVSYNSVDYSIISNNIIYAVRLNQQYKTVNSSVNWVNTRNLPYSVGGDDGFKIFDATGKGYANCVYGTAFVNFYSDFADTTIPHGSLIDPHSFSFINSDTGYFLKTNQLYKTQNRGITREVIHSFNLTAPYSSWHIFFLNDSIGFVYGKNGTILKTTNGGTTSIANPTLKKKIRLYPNPVTQKINIEHGEDVKIQSLRLMDMNGKQLRKYAPNSKILDVSNIPTGVYLLEINTDKGSLTESISVL